MRVTLTLGYVVERLRRSELSCVMFGITFLVTAISMITYVSSVPKTAKRFYTIAQGRGFAAHPG